MNFTRPDYLEESTCLQGYVTTTYAKIEAAFGKPTMGPNVEGDKTTCEWEILFEDGTPATIYDWKVYETDFGLAQWHIGGSSKRAVELVKSYL